jgi:hypothetical protein
MSRSDHENGSSSDGAGQPARIEDSALVAGGLAVAWIGGLVCGWRAFHDSNLLEAVLRGALTWLALVVLWLIAVSVCRRCVFRSPIPQTESGVNEAAPGPAAGQAES